MTRPIAHKLEVHDKHYHYMNFLVYLPKGYSSSYKSWPVIMYLHGEDDRGDQLELIEREGLPLLLQTNLSLDAIVVCPQCPQHTIWSNETDTLKQLFDALGKNYQIDHSKRYLTGWSMGGFGVWKFATQYPDYLAAIAPISSSLLPSANLKQELKKLHRLPIWAFHGEQDTEVPIESSQYLIDQLKGKNPYLKFTRLPSYSHNIWQYIYHDAELYNWMLECRS